MANYMQHATNVVALFLATIFMLECVRGIIIDPRDPARRSFAYLAVAVVAVAVAGNLGVYAAVNRASHVPALGKLLLDGTALVLAWALQKWVLHWTHPPATAGARARRLGWLLVAALVLLAVCFLLAPIDRDTPLSEFYAVYGRSPWIWCYGTVFAVSFGFAQLDLVRMSRRYLALADSGQLRLSLRLLAIGGTFGIIALLDKAIFVALTVAGMAQWWPDQLITRVSQAGAFYCIGFGATCATWLPRLSRWLRFFLSYRRMFPLWKALRRSFPGIALDEHPAPAWMLLRPSTFRTSHLLYRVTRLVTEINDGRLRLRPYLDSSSPSDPAAEGRRIAAALSAYHSGEPKPANGTAPMVGGADLHAEISWLASVGLAWRDNRRSGAITPGRRRRSERRTTDHR